MRTHAKPVLVTLLLSLALPAVASAQSNPNADQILNSLMPRPGMAGGTRGIRPAGAPIPGAAGGSASPGAATAATHAAMRAPLPAGAPTAHVPAQPEAGDAPSVTLSVLFATNSAELTPAAMRTLDQLGIALSSPKLAGDRFRIEGHTDTVGGAEQNRTLSARRADGVADYLAEKFHVARDRLEAAGLGEEGLLVQTGAGVAEQRNRRVVVVNLGA